MIKEKSIFLSDREKNGVKLYSPVTKKITIWRDVELDGEDYWRWSIEDKNIKILKIMIDL